MMCIMYKYGIVVDVIQPIKCMDAVWIRLLSNNTIYWVGIETFRILSMLKGN